MSKRIVITGGHFTPGLAVVEELKKRGWEIYWIGEKKAVEGKRFISLEAAILPNLDIPFYPIVAAKLHRRFSLSHALNLWKLPVSFLQSLYLLLKIKPIAVLSFGSYVSVPVAWTAWMLGIPVVIHEQTAVSGLANRLVSRVASKIAISFPQAAGSFPIDKVVVTGNPVRLGILLIEKKWTTRGKPTLYITGGSRGSQVINKSIAGILPDILKICVVYHQTGYLDLADLQELKSQLPKNLKNDYHVEAIFDPVEVEKIYTRADLIISRAGANTVSEVAVLGIPAIFIPIPWVESDEQKKNALMLEELGSAVVLPENQLSGEKLLETVTEVIGKIKLFKENAKKAGVLVPKDAASRIADLFEQFKTNETSS